MKQIETITIDSETRLHDLSFSDPCKYFIINASGDAVYFKTRSKQKAQEAADSIYGVGKYLIRNAKI